MLDTMGMLGGIVSFFFGAGLVFESVSDTTATSSALLLTGAGLFALGLLTVAMIIRSRRERTPHVEIPPEEAHPDSWSRYHSRNSSRVVQSHREPREQMHSSKRNQPAPAESAMHQARD